jgi:hypothetical protein
VKDKITKSKVLLALTMLVVLQTSHAACDWVWVDGDNDVATAPERQWLRSTITEVPTIPPPSVAPIQTPSIVPVPPLVVPPAGLTNCSFSRTLVDGVWVQVRICN